MPERLPGSDSWTTVRVTSLARFDKIVSKMKSRQWVFRGQSDAGWPLESSLYRLFDDILEITKGKKDVSAKNRHERLMIEHFRSTAHLYLDHLPDDDDLLAWLSILQHYGGATRLLDATFSPYVALFFALERGNTDNCVFAWELEHYKGLDVFAIGEDYRDSLVQEGKLCDERGGRSFFFAYEPSLSNTRSAAQQALFLVPSTNHESFETVMSEYGSSGSCTKIVIPNKLRYEGLLKLQKMNITAASLFPGLDGYCRSLRLQLLVNAGSLERLD